MVTGPIATVLLRFFELIPVVPKDLRQRRTTVRRRERVGVSFTGTGPKDEEIGGFALPGLEKGDKIVVCWGADAFSDVDSVDVSSSE